MWKKVLEYIKEYQMLEPGDRVIAAVSGGADSVCLLSVLEELSRTPGGIPMELLAVHVHHGLRGAEADRDAEFVREFCARLGVPVVVVKRDVAGYASGRGLSVEEAGRILRYEALEQAAADWGAGRIAVAHHRDDNAETILHHLVRGSGLRGLAGMRPVQGMRIRPLLGVDRQEILAYLASHELSWCEDSTNGSEAYTRNRIRSRILPELKEYVNAGAADNILRAGELFAQADEYLEKAAERVWNEAGTAGPDEASVRLELLSAQEPVIRTYVYRHMLDLIAPGQKDITSRHYAQIDGLVFHPVGGHCDLPEGLQAERGYEKLSLMRQAEPCRNLIPETRITLPLPGEPPVRAGGLVFQAFFRKKDMEIPQNQYTKWLDYDRIKGALSVRSRRTGDYLTLPDGGRKPVARYMIDEKIPRKQRDELPVLAEESHVIWVVGYRISEYYKITEDTNTILQVAGNGGEDHGGEDSGIIVRGRSQSEDQ